MSCPNVETGVIVGTDPDETAAMVEHVLPVAGRPLVVKLSPNAADPAAVALAAEQAGAGAISLINTLKGMALDPRTGAPWLGAGSGGVSGPAVRAVALQQVSVVCQAVSIPVVGMGGISTGAHAADFLRVGRAAASRSAPRASGTRPRGPGSPPNWPKFSVKSGISPAPVEAWSKVPANRGNRVKYPEAPST